MKRNWLYVIVIIAVTLSVWGGMSAKRTSAAPINFAVWTFEATPATNPPPSIDVPIGSTATPGLALTAVNFVGGVSGNAWTATNWSMTAAPAANTYYEFNVNLSNYGGIAISLASRRSTTGPATYEIQYSTDGTNFAQVPSSTTSVTGTTTYYTNTVTINSGSAVDLAIRGKPSVYFRIYGYNATGTGGTFRIDNVTFNASTNPTAVTLTDLTASTTTSPAPIAFGVLGLTAAALLLRRKTTRSAMH